MKSQSFRIPDLLDLEYFFHEDEDVSPREKGLRDRRMYIEKRLPETGSTPHPEKEETPERLLFFWLIQRRNALEKESENRILPGAVYLEAFRMALFVFFFLGLFAGGAGAFSFLAYQGDTPVNVFLYLGLFVGIQLVLLLFLGISLVMRKSGMGMHQGAIVYGSIRRLFSFFVNRLVQSVGGSLAPGKKNAFENAFGILLSRKKRYEGLFFPQALILGQVLGVGFYLGVLFATLFRVAGWDVAFGWQSSLDVGPRGVYELVRLLSAPWSWIIPHSVAFPDLSDIEGSRIILKEGIRELSTGHLLSWWPFLVFCVLVYGLLPRILLLFLGWAFLHLNLKNLDFNYPDAKDIIRRMKSPFVVTSAEPVQENPETPDMPEEKADYPCSGPMKRENGIVGLLPEDVVSGISPEEFEKGLKQRLFCSFAFQGIITMEKESDEDAVENAARIAEEKQAEVVLLLEGWMPPIRETVEYIQWIREKIGEKIPMRILLVGKPEGKNVLTPLRRMDKEVWQKKMLSMKDPYLKVEEMVR